MVLAKICHIGHGWETKEDYQFAEWAKSLEELEDER